LATLISGVGGIATASASPISLTFPARNVGTTSIPQTVTLTNSGGGALSISSISLTGTNASEFTTSNSCGGSLAPNSSCTISASFAPISSGPKSATLQISGDTTAGLPISIALSGTAN